MSKISKKEIVVKNRKVRYFQSSQGQPSGWKIPLETCPDGAAPWDFFYKCKSDLQAALDDENFTMIEQRQRRCLLCDLFFLRPERADEIYTAAATAQSTRGHSEYKKFRHQKKRE